MQGCPHKLKDVKPIRLSRKLNLELLKQNSEKINEAQDLINKGEINKAEELTRNVVQAAIIPSKKRHAQIWFDSECYKAKKQTLRALHAARIKNHPESQYDYAVKRKEYKKKSNC
mgnify:CR=1 FL=1